MLICIYLTFSFLILVFVVLMLLNAYQHALATNELLAAIVPVLLRQYDAIIELRYVFVQSVTLIRVVWLQHAASSA